MSRFVTTTLAVAAIGLGLSWLSLYDSSPAAHWLSTHPLVVNIAADINTPTMLLALRGFPGSAAPPESVLLLVLLAQWLVYGLVAAAVSRKLWPNNSSKPTPLRGAA